MTRRTVLGWLVRLPIEFHSPMPPDAVLARVRVALGPRRYQLRWWLNPIPGAREVRGTVRGCTVWLTSGHRAVNNSWRPTLRARVSPSGTGSRLHGRMGAPLPTLVFQAAAVVGCAYYLLVRGEVAALGFAAFFVALAAFGTFGGRHDETALRSWLIEELDAREARPEGPDPLSGAD